MEQLMLVAGFVPLPYVLYSIVQTLRKRPHANFFGVLLAYLAVLIPVGVFAWGTARQTLPELLTLIIVISAALTFLFGLVLLIRELRSAGRKVTQSYGLLNLGVSALIALGLVATPTILALIPNATVNAATAATGFPAFGQGMAAPGSTDLAAEVSSAGSTTDTTASAFPAPPAGFEAPSGFALADTTAEADAAIVPEATATAVPTRAPSRQAVLPTITPTVAVTATPLVSTSATPTTEPTCALLTIYNLNLRAEPSADAQLLTTIPFSTTLTAYEVNTDGWWRVEYAGQVGWVNGEYVSAATACIALTGN